MGRFVDGSEIVHESVIRRSVSRSSVQRCITFRDTMATMAQAISVRLDDEAARALRSLEASGMTRSEAIRTALIDSARRLRERARLADEAAALEADDADREEMLSVAALMESLRAAR